MLRRALELWPEVTLTRTAPFDLKSRKSERFTWTAIVADYGGENVEHISFNGRTLPDALALAIKEGASRSRARRKLWKGKKR
jgi:hypothetical protein